MDGSKSPLRGIFRPASSLLSQGSRKISRSGMRFEDFSEDVIASFPEVKVSYPKSMAFKPYSVMITNKLLCIGSKEFLKHVLNLQWIILGDLHVDEASLELTFSYDDQEKKLVGKFRFESFEQLTKLEKTLRSSVESSRLLKLPTRPSHKTMSIYMNRDVSEDTLLIKLIESVTKLDEFLFLKSNANNLLKQNSSFVVDQSGLLDRCIRPCYLLTRNRDIPEYADNRFCDPIAFLEADLATWIESLEVQKMFPVADAIRKLMEYYSRTREMFKQIGYSAAKVPPNTITLASHLASPRIIDSSVLRVLLTGPKEGQGLAHVTKSHGVYWKQNPSHPGVEFQTDSLSALVSTRATSASCLLKFSYYEDPQSQSSSNNGSTSLLNGSTSSNHASSHQNINSEHSIITAKPKSMLVLASKAVHGKTLREVLQNTPQTLNQLDMESFSEIFIISLLTRPQDWKSDNLIVSSNEGKTILVGIDNDHSFADPVITFGQEGKHTINVKNILFCLPHCDNVIHPNTRDKILRIDPVVMLFKWIHSLNKQNTLYQSLHDQKFLSILDLKQLNLPQRLRAGTCLEIYRVITTLQKVLKESPEATLNHLFLQVYPILYHYYAFQNLRQAPDMNIESHFNTNIWSTPAFENFPDLLDTYVVHQGVELPIKEILPSCTNTAWDLFKGDRMPVEEAESLLKEIDFSSMSSQAEMELISLLKKISFMNLTIIGSSLITGGDLASISDSSPGLVQIQLFSCPKISKDALNHGIFKTKRISIYLSGCPISQSEVDDLTQQGFHISLPDSEAQNQIPRGSMALEAPSIFNALESIRSGRFDEAYECLLLAEKLPPNLISKYTENLLSNLPLAELLRSKHQGLLTQLVRLFNWNVNSITMTGQRAWHLIVENQDISWCKFVASLCPNLNINCQNANLETAVHIAVREGDIPLLVYLVQDLKCDTTICDAKMRTPLANLIRNPRLSNETKNAMAKIIIDCSKDLNGWRDSLGNNYLHIALRNRLLSIAIRLIRSGIKINAENTNGQSPLHYACLFRCRDVSENGTWLNMAAIMIEAGASPLSRSKNGQTALHYAVQGGSTSIIRALTTHCPQLLTIADNQGLLPTHLVAGFSSVSTLNSLREFLSSPSIYQVDWNAQTSFGVTPLMLAAQKSNWQAIDLLCTLDSIQVDLKDKAGNTALFYAVTRTCLPAVHILLKKKGANPNIGDGFTSAMWRSVLVLYKDNIAIKDNLESQNTASTTSTQSQTDYSSVDPNSRPISPISPRSQASQSQYFTIGSHAFQVPQSFKIDSTRSASANSGGSTANSDAGSSVKLPASSSPPPSFITAASSSNSSNGTASLSAQSSADTNTLSYASQSNASTTNSSTVFLPNPTGIRHQIASAMFHYGGDIESPNSLGSYLLHEVANRVIKDGSGSTGPSEFEFILENAPHTVNSINKSGEHFLHILARMPANASACQSESAKQVLKRYLQVGQQLTSLFEKPANDGMSIIHNLVQNSNHKLLQVLAQSNAQPTSGIPEKSSSLPNISSTSSTKANLDQKSNSSIMSRLKFPFDATKHIKKHPILLALEIGNLPVCTLLFENMTFSLSKSEWKALFLSAMRVGCLEMAKNSQLRCQPSKA